MTQPNVGPLSELQRLGREAAALAERLRAAPVEASGRDPSGQVRVDLSAAGRITSVRVESRWRTRLAADGLGGAVLAAYRQAAERRLTAWAADVGRDDRDPSPVDVPSAQPAVEMGPNAIRELWYLLQDASDRLEALAEEAVAHSQAVSSGHDADHRVTATFTGGVPTEIDVDARWAARTDGGDLGTAITAAVVRGYAAVDRLADRSLTRQWPFPDLRRLAGDPATLLATLGLPGPETEGA